VRGWSWKGGREGGGGYAVNRGREVAAETGKMAMAEKEEVNEMNAAPVRIFLRASIVWGL
jgi:hypothetical protein